MEKHLSFYCCVTDYAMKRNYRLLLLLCVLPMSVSCSDTPTMRFGDYDNLLPPDGDAAEYDSTGDNTEITDEDDDIETPETDMDPKEEPESDSDDVQEADPEAEPEEEMSAVWHFDDPWPVNQTVTWGEGTPYAYNALQFMTVGESPMVFFSPDNDYESEFAFNYFLSDQAAATDFLYTSRPGVTGEDYSLSFYPYSYRLNRAMTDRAFFMMGEYVENYYHEVVQHRESIALLPVSMTTPETIQTPDVTLTRTCAQIYSFESESHFGCWMVEDMQLVGINQGQSAFLFYLKEAMDSGEQECGSDLNAAGCYYSRIDEQNISFPVFLYRNDQPGSCPGDASWGAGKLHALYLDGSPFTTNQVQVWYSATDIDDNTTTPEALLFSTAPGNTIPSQRLLTDDLHGKIYVFAYERQGNVPGPQTEAVFLYNDISAAATSPWHEASGAYEAFISGSSAFSPPAFVVTPQGDVLSFVLKRRGDYHAPSKESFIEMWSFSPQTGDFSFVQTVLDHIPGFPDRDSPSTAAWPERKIDALYVDGEIYLAFIASGEYAKQVWGLAELGGYHVIGLKGRLAD